MRKLYVLLIGVAVILLIISSYFFLRKKAVPPVVVKPPVEHRFAYNINIDSLEVRYDQVNAGENLSAILSPIVSAGIIDRISRETRDVFDVRKIRIGNTYACITKKSDSLKALYFVYEVNDTSYVVYDLRDSLRAYMDHKNVIKKIRSVSGTIYSSLWNTFAEKKLDISLAMSMADVFAWTIDFYALQKGDQFRLIYEDIYVDNERIRSGKILAGVFSGGGKDFYAFAFDQEGKTRYFDAEGQSLERSFLKAPLHFSRISSRFTAARFHPILRIMRPHYGVDYAAPRGTPVVALGDGRVTEAGWKGGYGRFIAIRHNSSYMTTYAHLMGFAPGLKQGSFVKQGELIAFVGMSGLATGPHLDFRVYKNGSPINPLSMESPPAKPVNNDAHLAFEAIVKKLKPQVDSIK